LPPKIEALELAAGPVVRSNPLGAGATVIAEDLSPGIRNCVTVVPEMVVVTKEKAEPVPRGAMLVMVVVLPGLGYPVVFPLDGSTDAPFDAD
jgi:hypothetical protein